MNPTATLSHFRRLCDLPNAEQEAELVKLDGPVAEAVRRMLAADSGGDLRVSEATQVVGHAVAELWADDEEANGQVPDQIGPFRPVERLGGGATSHVYLAWQTAPRRLVAVKIVRRGVPAPVTARFLDEAQALADLALPAAPQVYAVGVHEQRPYVAMERVEGTPLSSWAATQPVAARVEIMAALCDAVQAAHAAGRVHRDLKPDHVIINAQGQLRLLDFGLSAPDGEGLGTPAYMPPEALSGARVGRGADTYALGVLLLEVLTGHLPASWTRTSRATPTLPELDPELAAVVQRSVADAPERRYGTAGELADDLRRALRHETVTALPAHPLRTLRLAARRHRRALSLTAAAVSIGLTASAGVVASRAYQADAERATHEATAAALAQGLSERMVELRREGKEAEARSLLALLGATPDLANTAAKAQLWLEEGLLHRHGDDARAALVEAAGHEQTRHRALTELASSFHRAARPTSLARVAAQLADRRWRDTADLWSRRLPAAHEGPLAGVLRRLATGTPTSHHATAATPGIDAGRPVIGLIDGTTAPLTGQDPALTTIQVTTLDAPAALNALPGWLAREDRMVLLTADQDQVRSTIGDHTEPVGTINRVLSWSYATTRPGPPTLYLGSGPWERTLYRAEPGRPAASAHPRTTGSDVNALAAADLTGDGLDELIVAAGPWSAYHVRALTADGDGLRVLAQITLGNVDALAVYEDAGPVVVAAKSNRYPSRVRFGDESPYGRPAGLYALRLAPERWEPERFAPLPVDDPELGAIIPLLLTADVDGDGRPELYGEVRLGHEALLWVVTPDRPDETLLIAGIKPLAAADLDGDGKDELIVGLPDRDNETWVLGAGGTPLPPLERPDHPPLNAAPDTPGLATARMLADVGLFDEAAARARALAGLVPAPTQAALLRWAADLLSNGPSADRAAAAWAEAAAAGATDAWPEVARYAVKAHDAELTLAAADALHTAPARRVSGEVTETTSQPAAWDILAPEAVRRWDSDGAQLTVFASHGDVLRASIAPGGDLFAVDITVDVTDIDPYGSAAFSLRSGDQDEIQFGLWGASGGGKASLRLRCGRGLTSATTPTREPLPLTNPVRLRARLAIDTSTHTAHCQVQDAAGDELLFDTIPLVAKEMGPWSIALRAETNDEPELPDLAATFAALHIRSAVLRGAALDPTPHDDPAHAWARGDRAAAAAVWERTNPALATWAWYELGEPQRAATLLRADAPCCLLHRLHRLQTWGLGAQLAGLQGPHERARFLNQSLPPGTMWPLDAVPLLLDPRLDDVSPESDEELMLWIQRARMIDAEGHPARARALLTELLSKPVPSGPKGRYYMSHAATALARVSAGLGDEAETIRWIRRGLELSVNPDEVAALLVREPVLRDATLAVVGSAWEPTPP